MKHKGKVLWGLCDGQEKKTLFSVYFRQRANKTVILTSIIISALNIQTTVYTCNKLPAILLYNKLDIHKNDDAWNTNIKGARPD